MRQVRETDTAVEIPEHVHQLRRALLRMQQAQDAMLLASSSSVAVMFESSRLADRLDPVIARAKRLLARERRRLT